MNRLKDEVNSYLEATQSLELLQSKEQKIVLDVISQVRKCGLDTILSIPQLVVCGDQSSGKSSVLEALTEIPFPRQDNLCTRYATEIILRRGNVDSITIKVIPDDDRSEIDKEHIRNFAESITDFQQIPNLIGKAMTLMGIDPSNSEGPAFTRDVLSIGIEGPLRPQLMLVDLPGLIQSATKGTMNSDVELVKGITAKYISQPRTICLAVVSAVNDYANQGILDSVRKVDPQGDRTLGIITKPDRLEANSGSEASFIDLAQNKDIFFKHGWHVLKNRNFQESELSMKERNLSEDRFFRESNFACLPKHQVGVNPLKSRLSSLLFDHVKRELPKLRCDLEASLRESTTQLKDMGKPRTNPRECRDFLMEISAGYRDTCRAAVNGYYRGKFFEYDASKEFNLSSTSAWRRLRATVSCLNDQFDSNLRYRGRKYVFTGVNLKEDDVLQRDPEPIAGDSDEDNSVLESKHDDVNAFDFGVTNETKILTKDESKKWVKKALKRNRGRELSGTYNPLIISELFWELSSNWAPLAVAYLDKVADVCENFLLDLLEDKCLKDLSSRIWQFIIKDSLNMNVREAYEELNKITQDLKDHPINFDRYYTNIIKTRRGKRCNKNDSHCHTEQDIRPMNCISNGSHGLQNGYLARHNSDLEDHCCEEILDNVLAIYAVSQETFMANVTMQVTERHILRTIEDMFSPLVVSRMSDEDVEDVASEPVASKRERSFLEEKISKLSEGKNILRKAVRTAV